MKKLRISALILSLAMFATLLAGCGQKNTTLVTIDGKAMPEYMFEYFVQSMANNYASQGMDLASFLDEDSGTGMTVDEYMKVQIVETLKAYVAIEKLAEENGLALTDDDKKMLEETKKQQVESAGGRSAFIKQLEEAKIQEEAIDMMSYYGAVYEKVYTALFGEGGKFAPTTEDVVSNVIPANIRVKHILIQATKDSEDYEEKKKAAQEAHKRAVAGEEFDDLIDEYNEDPGMESQPEGYIFDETGANFDGSGTMDSTFTAGAFALDVNEISPVIETSFGFHIIKRLPLDEAYISSHMDTFSAPLADVVFQDQIMELAEGLTVVETDAYKNFSLKNILGSGAASHEGHDHESTGTLEPEAEGETATPAE